MNKELFKISKDVYNVLANKVNHCTQEEFFNRYVKNNEDFYIYTEDEKNVIHFGNFKITIERDDE